MLSWKTRGLAAGIVLILAAGVIRAEKGDSLPPAILNAAQIVDQMQLHNQARNEELKDYKSLRQIGRAHV